MWKICWLAADLWWNVSNPGIGRLLYTLGNFLSIGEEDDKMKPGSNLVTQAFNETISSLKKLFFRCLMGISFGIFSYVPLFMLFIFIAWALAMPLGATAKDLLSQILLSLMLLLGFATGTAFLVSAVFGVIQNVYHGKKLRFFPKENLKKAAKVSLLLLAIILLLALPIVGVYSFSKEFAAMITLVLILVLPVLSLSAFILLYYLLPEMAIKNKGLIAAIKGSASLVRKNLVKTLAFGTALFIICMILFFIRAVISYALVIAGVLVLALVSALVDKTVGVILMIIGYLAYLLLELVMLSAIVAFYVIAHTVFYKLISANGRDGETMS